MSSLAASATRLDRFLPRYDFSELHSTQVAVSAERTWAALAALRPRDVPLVGHLMSLRRLPARLVGRQIYRGADEDTPVLEGITQAGFFRLEEETGREVIVGIIGRFWSMAPTPVSLSTPGDFLAFGEPGFAKAVMNFEVLPTSANSCRVVTETRIECTDPGARRRFGAYWFFVHPGSALIRRAWLRAVRRRAEAGNVLATSARDAR